MSCIITRKSRASIRGKLHHCQTYLRHFSHRRKNPAFSSRDSFPYYESHHDSYSQFPRSSLGTRGLQTMSHKKNDCILRVSLLLKQARLMIDLSNVILHASGGEYHGHNKTPSAGDRAYRPCGTLGKANKIGQENKCK